MNKQNWVMVDYENLQQIDLDLVNGHPVHVMLFIGQNQKSVPVSLLTKAITMREQVTVIGASGAGKNALDFQIAFHAGQISERDPSAFIHLVSKDKGFAVLVQHMKNRGLLVDQVASFSALKFLSPKLEFKLMPAPERADHATELLRKQTPASRPRKRKTLDSTVAAMFRKQLSAEELKAVVQQLISAGVVSFSANDAVTYSL